MSQIKKIIFFSAVFSLLLVAIYNINLQKAAAFTGSAGWSGSEAFWLNMNPYPVATFSVTSPGDAARYRYVDLSLSYCQHSAAYIELNGNSLVSVWGPGGPGGCGLGQTWPSYDLGVLPNGNYALGCHARSTDGTNTNAACTVATPPPTCTLSASPTSIDLGSSSTLSWNTTNTISATIDQGIGSVAVPSGSTTVSPVSATTYTMTVSGPDGSANCTATVNIRPPTCTLTASPSTIFIGESSTLSWNTTNATSASIDQGIGSVAVPSGSTTVSPVSATTYTMTVSGPGGNNTCTAAVSAIMCEEGLVPCGRKCDNLSTPNDETEECTVCHFFLMLKFTTDFVVKIAAVVGLLFLILSGLFYAFASGDSQRLHQARSMFIWTLVGFGIVLLAWLLITLVLTALGYIHPLGGVWNFIC